MSNLAKFGYLLIAIFIAVFLLINYVRQSAKNEVMINQQEQVIEQKNAVIKTKKFQQKLLNNPALISDVTARDNWLQLVWKKANSDR